MKRLTREDVEEMLAYWRKTCPHASAASHEIATDLSLHCIQAVPSARRGPRRSSWTNIEWQPSQGKAVPVPLAAIDAKKDWVRLDFRLPPDIAQQCFREGLVMSIDKQPRRGGRWVYSQVRLLSPRQRPHHTRGRLPKNLTLEKAKELLNQSFELEFGPVIAAPKEPSPAEATAALLATEAAKAEQEGSFDSTNSADARQRDIASIVRRQGQRTFRNKLLQIYGGRCAFSGCMVSEVLDAAHIVPYRGVYTNHAQNGLLLRTDLHTLFDVGLLAVDTQKMTIIVAPSVADSEYTALNRKQVALPVGGSVAPSKAALDQHRKWTGL